MTTDLRAPSLHVWEFDPKRRFVQPSPLLLASASGQRGLGIVNGPDLRELWSPTDFRFIDP
jgi:hypothetical protein